MIGRGKQRAQQRVYFELGDGTIIRPLEDYGMRIDGIEKSPPEVRRNTVEIEGRDGAIDFSEWTGHVIYKNRKVRVNMHAFGDRDISDVLGINGRKVKLRISDDPGWYYEGRCWLTTIQEPRHVRSISFDLDCYPYKLADNTSYTAAISITNTPQSVTLKARRMYTPLKIKATAAVNVIYNATPYAVNVNVLTTLPIMLGPEPIELSVRTTGTGTTGTATFSWQDGEF